VIRAIDNKRLVKKIEDFPFERINYLRIVIDLEKNTRDIISMAPIYQKQVFAN